MTLETWINAEDQENYVCMWDFHHGNPGLGVFFFSFWLVIVQATVWVVIHETGILNIAIHFLMLHYVTNLLI